MKRKLCIVILTCTFLLSNCKKYPENKSISLSTVKHRLIKQRWNVKEVLYNGNNINQVINDSLLLGDIENLQLNIDYLNSEKTGTLRYTYGGNEEYFFMGGVWGVYEKKKYISFREATGNGNSQVSNDIIRLNNLFNYSWTIVTLYKSDLKIENKKGFKIIFTTVN